MHEPNPFSVFVGPNGAGKSNIFEALELASVLAFLPIPSKAINMIGNPDEFLKEKGFFFDVNFGRFNSNIELLPYDFTARTLPDKMIRRENFLAYSESDKIETNSYTKSSEFILFFYNRYRIFLNVLYKKPLRFGDSQKKLASDGSNVELILKEIFQDKVKREELIDWLRILVPEFKDIEIRTSELSGEVSLAIYEKSTNRPFSKHLISDGTKNILALLAAVYQSDEPQFLCIEEPENGLHPYVIESLVRIFRNACKEKGHYIWLNTHSETLVRQLTIDEIIVVDKKNGATRARQFQGEDLFGLEMDEAWLTNALGGGLP